MLMNFRRVLAAFHFPRIIDFLIKRAVKPQKSIIFYEKQLLFTLF